eukprot:CAMPEP_0183569790 /NCGR_PEP_ID=MMETSP0371-20130417/121302_1 /TAXON_ID=268820 /ORGANISM="Peridinium aciculiferum, Strain PAER-2" /LENGTH=43 /DNA_ID= /DNA_START= /DNA_END= /DNA_ORIENTATION=
MVGEREAHAPAAGGAPVGVQSEACEGGQRGRVLHVHTVVGTGG